MKKKGLSLLITILLVFSSLQFLGVTSASAASEVSYKILMVFVTEVDATLTEASGREIKVDYKMSGIEKQVCEMIPVLMEEHLNEWFEGIVNFEIDTYFTTETIGNESFTFGNYFGLWDYRVMADAIPEVNGLIDNYQSVITTFSMDDYEKILHDGGGGATVKYAYINLETIFGGLLVNNDPYENLLDYSDINWEYIMDSYFHEFTHTIEAGLDVYEYHEVIGAYSFEELWGIEVARRYLQNEAFAYGERVGIPPEYWGLSKQWQTAPPPPTLKTKTSTSITLNEIAGAEYRLENGEWQDSLVFNGLAPNSSYNVYARMKETGTHCVSPRSTELLVINALLGDVNADGRVDITDVLLLKRHIALLPVNLNEHQKRVADVVHDGELNIEDVLLLQKFIAKLVTNLPA